VRSYGKANRLRKSLPSNANGFAFAWRELDRRCILSSSDSLERTGERMRISVSSKPKKRKIEFVDAFAGCGGLSLGLLQAGLIGRFAIEHDKFAFETLRTNLLTKGRSYKFTWPRWLPKEPVSIDKLLNDHEGELKALRGSIDLLVGGPPCQGFSSAGRRRHDDPRNKLFASYLRIVAILQPRAVLIENVRGFTMDFEPDAVVRNFSHELRQRLSTNYDVFEELLDLSQFGVPQLRTRLFLLAFEPGLCAENPFLCRFPPRFDPGFPLRRDPAG
jgi:DNA (cytosine-5)-methyltransferase 1